MALIPMEQALEKVSNQQTKTLGTLSTVEKQITDSNTGLFIQDASRSDILGLLAYCISVSGVNVSEMPKEAAKEVLIDFLISNYSSFRIQEVRTAFQMNAAGKLGEVIDHYQNFSAMYFGKVMAAFRKKSEELKKFQENTWSQKLPEPLHRSDEIPDEEMVRLSFANYLKIGNWQLLYPLCYDCLVRHGYGLSLEEGQRLRKVFNSFPRDKGDMGIGEPTERRFKQYLTSIVFEKFIREGKKEVRL